MYILTENKDTTNEIDKIRKKAYRYYTRDTKNSTRESFLQEPLRKLAIHVYSNECKKLRQQLKRAKSREKAKAIEADLEALKSQKEAVIEDFVNRHVAQSIMNCNKRNRNVSTPASTSKRRRRDVPNTPVAPHPQSGHLPFSDRRDAPVWLPPNSRRQEVPASPHSMASPVTIPPSPATVLASAPLPPRMEGWSFADHIQWKQCEKPTPFSFPIITDRLREKLSNEKLADRIKRMTKILTK